MKPKAKGAELAAKLRVLGDVAEQADLPHMAATLRDDSAFNGDATLRGMLREDQIVHWPTVRWLVTEKPRGSGRSTLLALAMIAESDANPGKVVNLWDHFQSDSWPTNWFRELVEDLLLQLQKIDPVWAAKRFDFTGLGLRRLK